MPDAEWIANGLLDPDDAGAAQRRELLAWLELQGCTIEDLVAAAASGNLASASADRRLRPRPTLTREDVAERTGMTPELVDRTCLASGFPPPPPGKAVFVEEDLALFGIFPVAAQLFGEDTLLAFTRVMGASMARIAEAADAMFLTDVEGPQREGGATPLELAQSVDVGITMLGGLPSAFVPLFRRHASAAIERSRLARAGRRGLEFVGPYRVPLTVGFADLVGFTAIAGRTEPRELAQVIGRFERCAADRAVAADVRLVKSIGDAVMVVGIDPVAVVTVLDGLVDDVAGDPVLGGVRAAGIAGDVLARDGDYVGPTVNLAARATKEAVPGGIVVNEEVADALRAAGWEVEPFGTHQLRGIEDPVVLWQVVGR